MMVVKNPFNKAGYFLGINEGLGEGVGPLNSYDKSSDAVGILVQVWHIPPSWGILMTSLRFRAAQQLKWCFAQRALLGFVGFRVGWLTITDGPLPVINGVKWGTYKLPNINGWLGCFRYISALTFPRWILVILIFGWGVLVIRSGKETPMDRGTCQGFYAHTR